MSGPLRKKTRRDLWERKGSLLALSAIIGLGVGCFVGMSGTYRDLDRARGDYYGRYRLADFTVNLKRAPHREVEALESLPNVRFAEGRVTEPVTIVLPGIEAPISGQAISLPGGRRPVVNDLLLVSGSWIGAGDAAEAILLEDFATARGLFPGDRIHVRLPDAEHAVLVVGIARSPEFVWVLPPSGGIVPDPANFGIVYLPEKFLQRAADLEDAVNQVVGLAHQNDPTSLKNTIQLLEERLDPYGVSASTPLQESNSFLLVRDQLSEVRILSRLFPAVFLLVGALVLNILLARLVAQQRTSIGTLRALGHTRSGVVRHYLGYGVTIGLLGGTGGLLLGWGLQGGMLGMYRTVFAFPGIEPHAHLDVFAVGMGISVACAILGTWKGVRRAARLEPAEAMRPPAPERGGKVLPERIGPLWRVLSFRSKMVLRTIFRNPFRSGVTVLAAAMATALVVATLGIRDAVEFIETFQFEYVSHEDRTLALRGPGDPGAVAEAASFTGVDRAEGWLVVPCDLSRGPYRKRMAVTALPADHTMYTPIGSNGVPIPVPSSGLILTSTLAQNLRARPGDLVTLRPLVGSREPTTVTVVSVVDSFIGLDAYCHLDQMSRLIGEERAINRIGLATRQGPPPPSFTREVGMRLPITGTSERAHSERQMRTMLDQSMGTALGAMILFAAVIAFGSVINTGLVSLSERVREVGTLRVLGAGPLRVMRIFGQEAILLNAAGIGLGLGAGIGLLHLFVKAFDTESFRFPVIVRLENLAASALLMLSFVVVAQFVLYRILRRLDWLEALKVKE